MLLLVGGGRGGGRLAGDVIDNLLHLRAVGAVGDSAEGVEVIDGRAIEHVRAEEDDQLLLLFEVGRGAEDIADDRDRAEARSGLRGHRALETAEDDDLAAHRAHVGISRTTADDGLVVAIQDSRTEDVFDRLRNL